MDDGPESTKTEMMVSNRATHAIGRVAPPQMQLRVPTNPGMLVQNRPGEVFEVKVDDETAVDRARYLGNPRPGNFGPVGQQAGNREPTTLPGPANLFAQDT